MNVESHRHQAVDHVLDLLFLRALLHYNNHFNSCSSVRSLGAQRCELRRRLPEFLPLSGVAATTRQR